MELLFLAQLAGCGLATGACSEPTLPTTELRPVLAPTIATPGECARIVIQIVSTDSVATTAYPPQPNCGGNRLVLLDQAGVTWNGSTRQLTLPVRIKNISGTTVRLPIRLELPVSGKSISAPSGTPISKLIPLNMDSTLAQDRKLWLIGGTGTLADGETTSARSLTFAIESPVVKARFWFVGAGEEVAAVPAAAPDSVPSWFTADSSYTNQGLGVLKRVVAVLFKATATQADRQDVIDQINGSVVGGLQIITGGEGLYYISIGGTPPEAQVDSLVSLLNASAYVDRASRISRSVRSARFPEDQTNSGWSRGDWTIHADSSAGPNWAAEEVLLPLAWGCETGDANARIAILDHPFDNGEFSSNVVDLHASYGASPSDPSRHGTSTAGIVASPGDNGIGIAGVVWNASLYLKDLGASPSFQAMANEILRAAAAGYPVVLLPFRKGYSTAPTAADSSVVATERDLIVRLLRTGSTLPLVVVPAGNDNVDAWYALLPALRDSLPGHVLVVGGSQPAFGAVPRDRWGRSDFTTVALDTASNFGSTINLYAPGRNVGVPTFVGGVEQIGLGTGTSFSAAQVAGIAGLLLAFDPTLTAGELIAKIDSGAVLGGRTMANHTNKYLANAYESLRLASNRSGTPVCGKTVRVATIGSNERIVIERSSTTADTLTPSQALIGARRMVSVAQGGRQVATVGSFGTPQFTDVFTLSGGSWTRTSQSNAFMTVYLERDTAYLRGSFADPESLWVRIGSTDPTRNVSEVLATAGAPVGSAWADWSWEWPAVSPTGDWILFDWIHDTSCDEVYTTYAFRLRGTPALVAAHQSSIDWCSANDYPVGFTFHGPMAWRNDGNLLLVAKEAKSAGATPFDIVLQRLSVSGSSFTPVGSPVTVVDRLPKGLYWEPEGERIRSAEQPWGGVCGGVIRSAASLATVLGTFTPCDYYPASGPTYAPGARASRTTGRPLPPWAADRVTISGRRVLP